MVTPVSWNIKAVNQQKESILANCVKIVNYMVETIEIQTYDTAIIGDLIVNSC